MSLTSAEKIFVDPKEELTFVTEKILSSEKEKIVLVVPENSLLFSSIISLKILLKLSHKESKSIILVTEDELGFQIAQKANVVTVKKVSQISSELWETALNKQLEYQRLENQNRKKFETSDDKIIPEEIIVDDNDVEDSENRKEDLIEANEELNEKKSKAMVVNLSGIEIYSGTDVAKFEQNDRIKSSIKDDMDRKLDLPENSIFSSDRFAGKDLSKVKVKKGIFEGIFSKFRKKNVISDDRSEFNKAPKTNLPRFYERKSFKIGLAIFAGLIVVGYILILSLSEVNINIEAKTEETLAEKTFKGNADLSTTDFIDNIFKVEPIINDELTSSRSVQATGEGTKGTKSKGVVTIFNQTEKQIQIPQGSTITSVANQKTYQFVNQVNLPAASRDTEGAINPSQTENILVEAVEFGEEYNIADSASTVFTISDTSGIEIRRDGPFEGGKSEKFVAIDQKDVDSALAELSKSLEQEGRETLEEKTPDGYRIIDGSVKFEVTEKKSSPDIGKEALEDGTFTLSVKAKISAYIVKNDELETMMAEEISGVSLNEEGDESSESILKEVRQIKELTLSEFKKNNDSEVQFKVAASGVTSNQINIDELKRDVQGKSLEDARQILTNKEEIKRVKNIGHNLFFLPNFLKTVPSNLDRIQIIIE